MPERLLLYRNKTLVGVLEFLDELPNNNFVFREDAANHVAVVCKEARAQTGNSFCDDLREHLQRQIECKAKRLNI